MRLSYNIIINPLPRCVDKKKKYCDENFVSLHSLMTSRPAMMLRFAQYLSTFL